jgi:hypothetical protein
MTETVLIGIATAGALWSVLVVAISLYTDDAAKTAELTGLLASLATLLAERGKSREGRAVTVEAPNRDFGLRL